MFAELTPPYSTIVADPPWDYDSRGGFARSRWPEHGRNGRRRQMQYSSMAEAEIAALPVRALAAKDAHLYLWTTNRYLRQAFDVLDAWGFTYSETLVWAKTPRGLIGGAPYTIRTEFVLFGRRGTLPAAKRLDRNWWVADVGPHSKKPAGFLDRVEQVSPGPYVELFARDQRFGWDTWGKGYESWPLTTGPGAPNAATPSPSPTSDP